MVNDKYEEKNEQYHTVAVALLNFLLDQHNGDTSFAPLLILSVALLANPTWIKSAVASCNFI